MIPHDCLMMDLGVYEAGRTAEQEGFDAVVIDTMSDSGMAALRSVLSIPVIGPGKASMLYAQTLGAKFSVLAQWKPALPRYRKVIRDYGFERQCASVRSFDVADRKSVVSGQRVSGRVDLGGRRSIEIKKKIT